MAAYDDIHLPRCSRCQSPVQNMIITPSYFGKGITVGVRCHGETQDVLLTWQEMLDYDGPMLRTVLDDRLTILAPAVKLSLPTTPPAQTRPPSAAQWVGKEEWLPIDDVVVAVAQQGGWHYTPSTWVPIPGAVAQEAGGPGHHTPRPGGTHTLMTKGGSIQSPVLPPKDD